MGGKKKRPKQGEGTNRDASYYIPSKIHVNHARNFSRADCHPVPPELQPHIEGSTFCFTLAEVEGRLREYLGRVRPEEDADPKACGQITAATIYLSATNDAFLVDGYLRHAAWLLAEVRGLLTKKTNVFKVDHIAQPKTDADWAAIRRRNYKENHSRKKLTAIDRAYFAQRLCTPVKEGGGGLTPADAALEMGLSSARQVNRLKSLLALPPDVRAKLHAGEMTIKQAEDYGKNTGQGTHKGGRQGVKHSNMRRALRLADDDKADRPAPKQPLAPKQLIELARILVGEIEVTDETNQKVAAWADFFDATADEEPEKPRKRRGKKKAAPKKIDETAPGKKGGNS